MEKIRVENGKLVVPDEPIIPYIEGDGVGPDIMNACLPVWNKAVELAYNGRKKIHFIEIYAGEKGLEKLANCCPKRHSTPSEST